MNPKKNKTNRFRGFTLVELILAVLLCSVAISAALAGYNFLFSQIRQNIERSNVSLQMAYALENIKLHCLSASAVDDSSKLSQSANSISDPDPFCFTGERDLSKITPNSKEDNDEYCYLLDNGRLVLVNNDESITTLLIDAKYQPHISFKYTAGDEPNFITVAITATAVTAARPLETRIIKEEGVRFWFAEATK